MSIPVGVFDLLLSLFGGLESLFAAVDRLTASPRRDVEMEENRAEQVC
jgi:hypothetical protein